MVSFGFLHRVVWLSFLVLDGRGWRGWEGRGKGEVGKDGEKAVSYTHLTLPTSSYV